MIQHKIISNAPEADGVSFGAETTEGFTLPDTTPEGRVVSQDQPATEFFEVDADLRHASMMQPGVKLVQPVGEQVRGIAESIRGQLHEFIHNNIRPPSRFGFTAQGAEPVNVDVLVRNCRQACADLEGIFADRSHSDGLSINVRTFAHRVQSSLEGFLMSLIRRQTTHGIGDGDLGEVLHECIALKGDLATTMQQIDALNVQLQAALMEQYQSLVDRRAERQREQ